MKLMPVAFDYLNHKGETRRRRITPDAIEFLAAPSFGYQPGWFLSGHDLDKNARRSFKLDRIVFDENMPGKSCLFSLNLYGAPL